jgi:hypothetical protein
MEHWEERSLAAEVDSECREVCLIERATVFERSDKSDQRNFRLMRLHLDVDHHRVPRIFVRLDHKTSRLTFHNLNSRMLTRRTKVEWLLCRGE